MMVFAASMAGLLFRRFEAARRSGELGVAAAKAQGEARFQALVHHSSDVTTLVDADRAISYQTPSITRLLGYAEDELIGTQLADLTHPEDRLSLLAARKEAIAGPSASTTSDLRLRHRDGSYRHVQSIHTNLLDNPDVRAVVVTTRDVTAQKELEAQLQHNAFHDTLTGLANRALFADRLDHALARTDRLAAPVAVLFGGPRRLQGRERLGGRRHPRRGLRPVGRVAPSGSTGSARQVLLSHPLGRLSVTLRGGRSPRGERVHRRQHRHRPARRRTRPPRRPLARLCELAARGPGR